MMRPGFAWSADGDTLRIRMEGDIQVLDPAFMIGGIDDVIMRGIYVSLNRLGDLREGAPWSPWGAEKLEQTDPKSIAFTLIDGLKWSNGFGPVTAEDVKFSYERIADPNMASPWAYQFEQLDHVEVVDARNGIIHLKNPYQPIFVRQPALLWRPHHLEGGHGEGRRQVHHRGAGDLRPVSLHRAGSRSRR